MLKNWMLILMLLISMEAFASGSQITIRGFHEWKSDKIQAAFHQLLVVKGQMQKALMENNKRTVDGLNKQIEQIKWNIEAAKDLSVTDYFVIYLSQQKHPDRFQQAAAKMSTKEVAQLMEAYANTLGTTPTEAIVESSQQALVPAKLAPQAGQIRDQMK